MFCSISKIPEFIREHGKIIIGQSEKNEIHTFFIKCNKNLDDGKQKKIKVNLSILSMGVGPFEMGKLVVNRENWEKLRTVSLKNL